MFACECQQVSRRSRRMAAVDLVTADGGWSVAAMAWRSMDRVARPGSPDTKETMGASR